MQASRLAWAAALLLPASARMYYAPAGAPAVVESTGSHNAAPGRYPYAVYLHLAPHAGWFCSGSLIAPNLVLSAAHCAYDEDANFALRNAPGVTAWVGMYNITDKKDGRERHNVTLVLPHPDFDPRLPPELSKRDVAVFRLADASHKQTLALRTAHPSTAAEAALERTPLTLLGWGSTGGNRSDPVWPTVLAEAAQLYRSHSSECKDAAEWEICAWGNADNKGVVPAQCAGDSGGPLIQKGSGPARDVQWGVAVNGEAICGTSGEYAFTDVTEESVRSFIDKALADAARQPGGKARQD